MTLEQQVRDILEAAGVEDAQSLTPGDLLEAANLLNDIVRKGRREALEEAADYVETQPIPAEHALFAMKQLMLAKGIRALMKKED